MERKSNKGAGRVVRKAGRAAPEDKSQQQVGRPALCLVQSGPSPPASVGSQPPPLLVGNVSAGLKTVCETCKLQVFRVFTRVTQPVFSPP